MKAISGKGFITLTEQKDGKYFIDLYSQVGRRGGVQSAYQNTVVLLSRFYLRRPEYLKEDKKLRGKLTKILKLEKKRKRSK